MIKEEYKEGKNEILVIDEDETEIDRIRNILLDAEGESFEIYTSKAFPESLQLLSKNHFDAVLLDLGLHDINGLDALRLIRNHAPKTPILVITTEKEEHIGITALTDGAQEYLIKERLDRYELIRAIRHAIERKLIEESLILKDRAIESSINCICFLDMCGNVVYANKASICNLGYASSDKIYNRNLFSMIVNKSLSGNILRELMESGSWVGEVDLERADGESIHTQMVASLVKNDAGDPLCIMASWIDISERVLAQKEIEIRDIAISSSMNAIAIADLDGNLINVNEAFAQLMGAKSTKELIGKPLSAIIGSDTNLVREWVHAIRRLEKWSGEFSLTRADVGSEMWLKAMINLVRDKEKNPLCIIASFTDITEQKNVEHELIRSEKKYRQLFDLAYEGIWVIDKNDAIQLTNLRMVEMLGYTKDEMLGKPIYSFVDSSSATDLKDFLDTLKKNFHGMREICFVRKNGKKIYSNISASVSLDHEGRYSGLIAFVTDISDRKRYENELKAAIERLKESKQREQMYFDFLAHDIANIVSPILIYAEMVLDAKNVPSKVKEVCEIIAEQALKASSLISNLRKMEELESVSQDQFYSIDLKLALSEAEENVCKKFKNKTFAISHSLPKDKKVFVKDFDVIRDIIEKILDNAARYCEKPVVEIDVRLRYEKKEPGKGFWRLEISDHGPGIPDSRKASLMATADPTKRLTRGIYTSLPFCMTVVRRLGGEMQICDVVPGKYEQGTKFVLRLPEGDAIDT